LPTWVHLLVEHSSSVGRTLRSVSRGLPRTGR
jgi:hypothetical protein